MPRNPRDRCELIQNSGWEFVYGTTASGNLPQYNTDQNQCTIYMDQITLTWVKESDFHFFHMKCPYSTQANVHYVRVSDKLDPNYWNSYELGIDERTDHSATGGAMIRHSRGSKHGWLCTDDNCYYYTTVFSGSRYLKI